MNVASLKLCKELYELSGWDDTSHKYADEFIHGTHDGITVYPQTLIDSDEDREVSAYKIAAPAYDLGYLLRQLPDEMEHKGQLHVGKWGISYWRAGYLDFEPGWTDLRAFADTPEDAAARLAIELFKQGILERAA